jgi:hypothetical protein
MALELRQISVRLEEDAYKVLKLAAEMEEKDLGEKARELLTLILLGAGRAATIQAEKVARALASVNAREDDGRERWTPPVEPMPRGPRR